MSDYIQDPNNSKKQVPGSPPKNYYDRTSKPGTCTFCKTPNYVLITKTMTQPFGFFYGSSASFATLAGAEGVDSSTLTGSANYDTDWGLLTVGTKLDIHPTAWSGSTGADGGNVRFVYRGGLDGSGRP